MNAILKDDPPELELKKLQLSPGLERIVRRCLEKEPSRRFQSASDLGFAIEALSGTSGSTPAQRLLPSPRKLPRLFWLAAALVLIVAAVGFLGGSKFATYKPPTFQSIAFGPGFVSSARFTPDGANVIYGAGWNGKAIDLFSTRLDGIESRAALGLPPADILAISGRGDMAILLNRHHYFQWMTIGTLALAQLSGGSARPLLENVSDADISPDGKDLAVARFDNNQQVLEFPIGKPLYRTSGWIDHPAIAPDGKQVAFLEHPVRGDDRGYVAIVAESGKVKRLTQEWVSLKGLVWSRRTNELWFSASVGGEAVAVRALSLSGRQRIVLTAPSDLLISDISSNGQVLLLTPRSISEIALRRPGQTQDRVMDFGTSAGSITGMSDDGSLVGLNYAGAGSGIDYLTYVVKTDEGELIRLGEGDASCLSPDGKWLVSFLPSTPGKMVAYPTGPGEVRHFDVGPVLNQGIYCSWMRDSKHFVFTGAESGKSLRGYLVDINTGKSRSVTPEGTSETLVSPDGRFVLARNNDGFALYPTDGAPPLPVRGMSPNELPIQWDMSGSQIYVWNRSFPARLRLINPTTGAGKTWLETMPPDPAGLLYANLFITPDGKSYAYRYRRVLSTLYLTDGLY
jgi:dipeptidyl aminopeptidase/acylaminoacyl peptidase